MSISDFQSVTIFETESSESNWDKHILETGLMLVMRLWLLTLLVVILSICDGEAAKGGAKSIMRGIMQ